MYVFQNEFTIYSCLHIKELLARNRREIWSLSEFNGTRTHKHLVRKRTLDHLAKMVKWVPWQVKSSLKFRQLKGVDSLWNAYLHGKNIQVNVHWCLEKHPLNLVYNFYIDQIFLIYLLALFLITWITYNAYWHIQTLPSKNISIKDDLEQHRKAYFLRYLSYSQWNN